MITFSDQNDIRGLDFGAEHPLKAGLHMNLSELLGSLKRD